MNGRGSSWNAYQDQHAASSDEELPAKGKATFKERSAAVGREAALQKQLQEAARDRQDLAKRYEAKDQKCNELRDKLKVAKAALMSRERELEMAQRMLQKLGQEKTQLREENADSKVYTRKLEARLEELKGAAELSSRYQAAKQKAHDFQQQLQSVNAELDACKDVAAQRAKEVERLNRALEIRASELSQEAGGQDIPAKLLHALAESREESLELAKQLAATKAEMNKLKASASRLNQRLEAAELMRADAEVAAEQLRQRLEKLVGSSQEVTKQRTDMGQLLVSARSEAETYKAERDELAEVVLEIQEEIEALKAAAAAAQTHGEVAAAAAADQAIQHIATSHAAAEDARQQQVQREAQLSQRCAQLSQQSAQLKAALQQQLTAAQQSAAARQQQILVLESQLQTRRQRELDLERQVASLQAEADKLGGAISSAEAAASRTSQLEHQVLRLEASLRVADVERQQLEQRLQQMGDDAVAAQQEVQREIDGLRVQLASKEAAYRCALEDIEQLQKQLNKAMEQLDRASTSKAQLQHNMLHQISSIKEKLQQAELHSQQQLMQPTSPIFRNRVSSASIGLRSSHNRGSGAKAVAHTSSLGQIEMQPQISVGDTIAAAALDAARRVKAGSAVRRSLGQMKLAGNIAAAAAAPLAKQKLARHSIGCISSVPGGTSWQQQQRREPQYSVGRGLIECPGDRQLANAAASKVADFAAGLQQPGTAQANAHRPGALSAVLPTVDDNPLHSPHAPRNGSGSGRSVGVPADAGPGQFAAHIPPITISSYAGSTAYADGDLELDQEVGYGVRSAAVMQLASPPGSRRMTSSGGGAAVAAAAAGLRSDVAGRHGRSGRGVIQQQQQQQLMRHSSAGLADALGSEGIDWRSILKAADLPEMKLRSWSPTRPASALAAPTAAAAAAAAAGHLNNAGSLSPAGYSQRSPYISRRSAAEPVATQHGQQQLQQQDAAERALAVKRCASVPPQLQAFDAPVVGLPGAKPAKAPAGLRSSCSWLQQPVEPYSPSVVPVAARNAQQVNSTAAAAAGRGNDIADPYSLPGSAEPSAASLQGTSNGGATIATAGSAAAGGSMLRSTWGRGWQQQQQQHASGGGAAAYQLAAPAPQQHGSKSNNSSPSKQRQRLRHQGEEQLVRHAAHGQGSNAAAVSANAPQQQHLSDANVSNVLHACGALEVNLDSDSCSTDDNTSGDRGDNCHSSHTGQHVTSQHPSAGQHGSALTADTAGIQSAAGEHSAGTPGSPRHSSRLEASKAALRELTSRSRQASNGTAPTAAAARRVSESSSICSTEQQGCIGQGQTAASACVRGAYPAAGQQRTPLHAQAGGPDHGGTLLTPPSTKRALHGTAARSFAVQPIRMQELSPGALPQQQQAQQRARGQSGGSSKLHLDPSLSTWNRREDGVQDTGRRSLLSNAPGQQQQQQQQQLGYSNAANGLNVQQHRQQQQQHEAAEDTSRGKLEGLLTKLNEGVPTLQDLAQLEGLL